MVLNRWFFAVFFGTATCCLLLAVAYDPKVVIIWEGMRRYFREDAHLSVEVILFQSYEAQVSALLAGPGDFSPHIDIAWNTNLAYLQADAWDELRQSEPSKRPRSRRASPLGIAAPRWYDSLREASAKQGFFNR